jgi:hypothetical protein
MESDNKETTLPRYLSNGSTTEYILQIRQTPNEMESITCSIKRPQNGMDIFQGITHDICLATPSRVVVLGISVSTSSLQGGMSHAGEAMHLLTDTLELEPMLIRRYDLRWRNQARCLLQMDNPINRRYTRSW